MNHAILGIISSISFGLTQGVLELSRDYPNTGGGT